METDQLKQKGQLSLVDLVEDEDADTGTSTRTEEKGLDTPTLLGTSRYGGDDEEVTTYVGTPSSSASSSSPKGRSYGKSYDRSRSSYKPASYSASKKRK